MVDTGVDRQQMEEIEEVGVVDVMANLGAVDLVLATKEVEKETEIASKKKKKKR